MDKVIFWNNHIYSKCLKDCKVYYLQSRINEVDFVYKYKVEVDVKNIKKIFMHNAINIEMSQTLLSIYISCL